MEHGGEARFACLGGGARYIFSRGPYTIHWAQYIFCRGPYEIHRAQYIFSRGPYGREPVPELSGMGDPEARRLIIIREVRTPYSYS